MSRVEWRSAVLAASLAFALCLCHAVVWCILFILLGVWDDHMEGFFFPSLFPILLKKIRCDVEMGDRYNLGNY
jgi:hypothetical protein